MCMIVGAVCSVQLRAVGCEEALTMIAPPPSPLPALRTGMLANQKQQPKWITSVMTISGYSVNLEALYIYI